MLRKVSKVCGYVFIDFLEKDDKKGESAKCMSQGRPVTVKSKGPERQIVTKTECRTFYVCDLGTRGRLKPTKLTFGLKTTQKENITYDNTKKESMLSLNLLLPI